MSRLLVAALALAAGASAAPSLVLAPGLAGDARRATYESVTQTDVLAGVLRAAGVAASEASQRWGADLQLVDGQPPRLVAVVLTEAYGSKQELRDAVAASPASLALVNAEQEEPAALGGQLADAVAAARSAGGDVSPLLVSGSCQEELLSAPAYAAARHVAALPESVAAAAGSQAERTVVLLACPPPGGLASLRAALVAAVPDSVLLLLPTSGAAHAAAPAPVGLAQRRVLLGVPAGGCDDVCTAQTSLLMFAAVFTLYVVMALSGVCCLHALEGPSRFELSAEQKHGQ